MNKERKNLGFERLECWRRKLNLLQTLWTLGPDIVGSVPDWGKISSKLAKITRSEFLYLYFENVMQIKRHLNFWWSRDHQKCSFHVLTCPCWSSEINIVRLLEDQIIIFIIKLSFEQLTVCSMFTINSIKGAFMWRVTKYDF